MAVRTNRLRAVAALVGAALAAWPGLAFACPQCAGREDGGPMQAVFLGIFVTLPFAIVWVVYRFIRSEPSGGASRRPSRLRS